MSVESAPTLEGVCEFLVDCLHRTAPTQDTGFPLIRTPNIGKGRLALDEVFRVSEAVYEVWTQRAVPQPGDLILAREAPAGNVAIVKDGQQVCLGQRTVHLRPDSSVVDPDFLCYFLLAPLQQGRLLAGETGVTARHVNMSDIRKLPLEKLPPLSVQVRVGALLAAYDDLIENNRRRMVLLEEAARLLYREWFVLLRFPGHEHTRITGGCPTGWTRMPLDEICTIGRGASPRPINDFLGGDVPWFKIGDATASESPFILATKEQVTDEGSRRSVFVVPGDLVLSNSATCGVPFFAGIRGCVHDGWLHFSDYRRVSPQFLYCLFHERQRELVSSVGDGSTQKNLNTAVVGRLETVLPNVDGLLRGFDEVAQRNFTLVFNLAKQNVALRAARDLLLPRLMSGEITV
jgi:type I restriction enzyme S subunit